MQYTRKGIFVSIMKWKNSWVDWNGSILKYNKTLNILCNLERMENIEVHRFTPFISRVAYNGGSGGIIGFIPQRKRATHDLENVRKANGIVEGSGTLIKGLGTLFWWGKGRGAATWVGVSGLESDESDIGSSILRCVVSREKQSKKKKILISCCSF